MTGLSLNYHRNVWRNMSANIFQPINHADPQPTQPAPQPIHPDCSRRDTLCWSSPPNDANHSPWARQKGSYKRLGTDLYISKPGVSCGNQRFFGTYMGYHTDISKYFPGEPGAEVSEEKNYRNILPIECAQGDRPARCPNHFFAVNEPSAVPWWWCDLFRCHEVACGVRWSNVVGCEVTWGELLWLVATWHVMSCHLMWWSRHLMRCDCCVVSCHVMQCDVMVMSSYLLRPAMGWNAMSLRCHWLWGHLVWFDVVL